MRESPIGGVGGWNGWEKNMVSTCFVWATAAKVNHLSVVPGQVRDTVLT